MPAEGRRVVLFNTVIPLIVIGFAYSTGFAENASIGNLVIRQMNVHGAMADTIRETFERSSQLKSVLTVTVVIGFLLWGIPMSLTVARVFERAWRRSITSLMSFVSRRFRL